MKILNKTYKYEEGEIFLDFNNNIIKAIRYSDGAEEEFDSVIQAQAWIQQLELNEFCEVNVWN